jgi:hypothetical protein
MKAFWITMQIIKAVIAVIGLCSSLFAKAPHNTVTWNEIYNIKDINATYVPQGIEVYEDYVLFSVHANDEKSVLIVFKKEDNKTKLTYLFEVDFPTEATHTSDLNILDDTLYAMDYASNKIYAINLKKLLEKKELVVESYFYLNMKKTGSFAFVKYEDEVYVLVSQFILTNKLTVFKLEELKNETLEKSKIAFTIKNNRFVQGLYTKYNMLLIATNNFGIDTITIVDIPKMMKSRDVSHATMKTINAPYKMVEDIAIYQNTILTSDEESFMIYQSQDLTK